MPTYIARGDSRFETVWKCGDRGIPVRPESRGWLGRLSTRLLHRCGRCPTYAVRTADHTILDCCTHCHRVTRVSPDDPALADERTRRKFARQSGTILTALAFDNFTITQTRPDQALAVPCPKCIDTEFVAKNMPANAIVPKLDYCDIRMRHMLFADDKGEDHALHWGACERCGHVVLVPRADQPNFITPPGVSRYARPS